MEKVTKAILYANILSYKSNYKRIKNLFHDIGHSLLPETAACIKAVLQLSADELEWIRKQIFLIVDESTLYGIQYLNILVEA